MRKHKLINPVTKHSIEGKRLYFYFRPPPGMDLPEGISRRLPDSLDEAEARAQVLLAQCVPFGLASRSKGSEGRIEDLTIETFHRARRRSGSREQEFALTESDVVALLRGQDYCCAISGIRFRVAAKDGNSRAPYRPSLDRIDCKKGYVQGNVRIVLVAVNLALSDWGEEVLYDIAEAIANSKRRIYGQA